MKNLIQKYIEPNKKLKTFEIIALVLMIVGSIASYGIGMNKVSSNPGTTTYVGSIEMNRDFDAEDYDEDSTVCDVTYVSDDKQLIVTYTYEQYEALEQDKITGHEYQSENGTSIFFDHQNPTEDEIASVYKATMANDTMPIFNLSSALVILAISLAIVLCFSQFFTTYEKCWFMTIMVLATIAAVIWPEESANGVNGIIIMLLYLLDTFLNILCELLISKQSRWNFLVSVAVEITEIVICIVLMYRFATMVTTLFFWLPIDIISFINWTKHKDEVEDQLTEVRRLKGYQEVLVLLGIGLWTVVVGYFLSGLDIQSDFIQNKSLETWIAYIDACASAVGVANGLFIFFRFREQWVAWYVCATLEAIINIITGQYVLLILKLGYFTNTTYGYIKWSRYIKTHKEKKLTLF